MISGSKRNKKAFLDWHNFGKNGRIYCDLFIEIKENITRMIPENVLDSTHTSVTRVGFINIDFDRTDKDGTYELLGLVG